MQKVWWQCAKSDEHVWQATILHRTYGHGCPYCANQKASKDNNLAARYPAVANQWHPTRNKPLLPTEITAGTGKSVWWRCFRSAKHVWQAPVEFIVRRFQAGTNGCPFCKGNKVTDESCLKAKFPGVAELWHSTLNVDVTSEKVSPSSGKVVWWQCPDVGDHVWDAPVDRVVTRNKKGRSGCPFCAGKRTTYDTSLAMQFPELARLWHPKLNKPLQPHQVTPGSNKIVWWRCSKDRSHVFERKINYMLASAKRGNSVCPECRENKDGTRYGKQQGKQSFQAKT